MNILDIAIAKKLAGGGGGSGTDNYNDLSNLPKINDTTLSGNKSSSALGLQSEINSDSKLASDLVDDTNHTNKFVTSTEKNTWNAKQNAIDNSHKLSSDLVDDTNHTNKFVTSTEKNTWNAKQNAIDSDHKLSSDLVDDANKTNKFVTSTEKNTWNAKQNAIDADHKLSSSLVSFTDAEAAAIASGIDSSKVSQISTNQTNILYSLQTGANNLCPESQLTIISNSKTKSLTVNLPAGKYYISCNATLAGNILADGVLKNSAGTAIGTASGFANGANVKSITIADTATEFYFYSTDANASFDNLMIVPEVIWNAIDHNFRTAAISNADLTKLEAEDRAGLIECVDEGAKNLNNANTWLYGFLPDFTTGVINVYDGGICSDYIPITFNADKYVVSGTPSTISHCLYAYNANKQFLGRTGGWAGNSRIIDETSFTGGTPSGTGAIAYVIIGIYGEGATPYDPALVMLTEYSKYVISEKVTPYALPNSDLTRMMTPFFTVPINHNMIYRGQNLGDTLTADQDTALSSGNFTDLYLGDYWTKTVTIPAFYEVTASEPADWSTNYTSYYTKSGDTYTPVSGDTAPTWAADTYYERLVTSQTVTLKAVIADFDTFYAGYNSTYAAINTHHAAVIVTGFSNVVWNKTNSTAGGYVASLIHKWLVGSALPQIETWFGSAKVLSHQKLLTNAITGDAASGWAWSSQKISLLSENQMYGSKVWGNSKAANGGYEPGEAFKHLNVFNHIDANLLFGNKNIWLRDIASAEWAAYLDSRGLAYYADASATWVAPAALILLS